MAHPCLLHGQQLIGPSLDDGNRRRQIFKTRLETHVSECNFASLYFL